MKQIASALIQVNSMRDLAMFSSGNGHGDVDHPAQALRSWGLNRATLFI
jgi:hypothetical protein